MPNEQDREYFSRREAQEREAATRAASIARGVHADLANRYARLIRDDESPGLKSRAEQ